jgi:hypothetical protein
MLQASHGRGCVFLRPPSKRGETRTFHFTSKIEIRRIAPRLLSPADSERWQEDVNTAELLLLILRGQHLGLCSSSFIVNKSMCEFVLRRGQDMRIFPDVLERRLKRLQPT